MTSSALYNRIYQRVTSEVNNDEQLCTYLAEICSDPNSNCDDLRNIIDTMVQTSDTKLSETRRQHLVYALLDMIEEDQQAQLNKQDQQDTETIEDDIERNEHLERDGECKLCGTEQKITSKIENKNFFSFAYPNFSSSSYPKTNSQTHEKFRQRVS